MIIGSFGYQRSGKTSVSLMIARHFQKLYGFEIYTNVEADNVHLISKMSDIPVDYKSKIVIFDEAYFFLDSRAFKDNKDFTLFLSTLGKQKILLFVTAPTPDLIDVRIRRQLHYLILAKGDKAFINYQFIDIKKSLVSPIFSVRKTEELFKNLSFNSNLVIPNFIEFDLENWISKVTGVTRQPKFNKKIL